MSPLQSELRRLGYRGTAEEFRELLADRFAELHPGCTVDAMLCDELAPRMFVRDVRVRSGLMALDHALILRTLLRMRKGCIRSRRPRLDPITLTS